MSASFPTEKRESVSLQYCNFARPRLHYLSYNKALMARFAVPFPSTAGASVDMDPSKCYSNCLAQSHRDPTAKIAVGMVQVENPTKILCFCNFDEAQITDLVIDEYGAPKGDTEYCESVGEYSVGKKGYYAVYVSKKCCCCYGCCLLWFLLSL